MRASAQVVKRSVAVHHDVQLYTLQVTMPRFLVAQFNTHCALARNSASSRAIPVATYRRTVREAPYVPDWGRVGKGMSPAGRLEGWRRTCATAVWHAMHQGAQAGTWALQQLGAAKEDTNRALEPWAWTTVVVTATDWQNFFKLRLEKSAQGAFRDVAQAMRQAMDASTPQVLDIGQWHLPYVDSTHHIDLPLSVAHCARVSYTKQGEDADPARLLRLAEHLISSGHMSPLEHQAYALRDTRRVRKFRGWAQYRARVEGHEPVI